MELFPITRYGEEPSATNDPEKQKNFLNKLLKKAEKKKRKFEDLQKLETEQNELVPKAIHNSEEKPKKRKLKVKETKLPSDGESEKPEERNGVEENHVKVLGDDVFHKKKKIDMILPPWLANPIIISNKLTDNDEVKEKIDELSYLSSHMKEVLHYLKIESLFPVQSKVIPWILNAHSKPLPFRPRDICVSAPTGSGKTLAFAIPIVQLLSKRVERKIRALIVLPVGELALQVYKVFKSLTFKTNLSVCLLSKSFRLSIEQQKLVECFNGKYYSKVDIVVTTPGRLVEHLHATKGFSLNDLKFLVIDEADRIMEQIYHNWLYHLDNHVKSSSDMLLTGKSINLCVNDLRNVTCYLPHKLLFSATLSQDPEKLQNLRLFQPKLFTSVIASPEEIVNELKEQSTLDQNDKSKEKRGEFIGKYTIPAELTEKYCITEKNLKPLTLYSLIKENSWNKFLCFTNSAENAHRLAFVLKKLFKNNSIEEISADLKLQQRTKILNNFTIGKIKGLISSDALTRGIDIPNIDIVISYDIPRHIKTYIHRIGRTARAGRNGTAITLLSSKELTTFRNVLAEAGKEPMNEIKVESNIEEETAKLYSIALKCLKAQIEREKKTKSLYKDIVTKKAIPDSETLSKMSIMERLQIQAQDIVAGNLEEAIKEHGKKSIKRNKK